VKKTKPIARSKRSFSIGGLLDAAGAMLAAATLAGFLGTAWWVLELPSHFRVQLAVGLALLVPLKALRRRWKAMALLGALAALNTVVVIPILMPDRTPTPRAAVRLRVASLNVNTANERFELVREFLRDTDADVILLMEVNERWMGELDGLKASHTNWIAEPRDDNFGIALFSRFPLDSAESVELGEAGVPSLLATASIGSTRVRLLATHPLPPGSEQYAWLRNQQLGALARQVRLETLPVVLLGDLNTAPWSPSFKRFLANAGLKNSSQGRGLFATWPAGFWPLRIPLDHCLVSHAIQIAGKRVGPDVGSDHLPVVIEIAVPGEATEAH
jgi:endonuclease/exonuclease/phosphatase (EEP) superfamily protein YafD